LKLGKKRRKSSERNYYIISSRVIIKAIIIKIKAQQSHEISVSKSLKTERSTFQTSKFESNLRWMPDQSNASPCLQRILQRILAVEGAGKESDDEDTLHPGGQGQEMGFNWVDDADE